MQYKYGKLTGCFDIDIRGSIITAQCLLTTSKPCPSPVWADHIPETHCQHPTSDQVNLSEQLEACNRLKYPYQ